MNQPKHFNRSIAAMMAAFNTGQQFTTDDAARVLHSKGIAGTHLTGVNYASTALRYQLEVQVDCPDAYVVLERGSFGKAGRRYRFTDGNLPPSDI